MTRATPSLHASGEKVLEKPEQKTILGSFTFVIDKFENIHAVAGSPRQGLHDLEGLVMVRQ